ncbi:MULTISPECIES: dTDP-4-dehydrorhamnose reductase [unclassified Bradyrhizobium]|uniref:dTDP-4-dehydrorhamnose reductase n=1 Tax=unclassified Bradyrhizobium TaxID=2631580 RepID=UPI0028E20947|nr:MULTISPECIES: dTDP-4-dehydrorhamnose reductase [unclassified Bradyrhizobium]
MRLYVIGSEGQVARSLREAAAANPDITIRCSTRSDLDLLRIEQIERALAEFSPDIVVNPAAYTAVDRAETEPDLAYSINSKAAGAVASAASRLDVPVIHLSTDYVFDGKNPAPYVETDATSPQSVYGRSKLAGEVAVASATDRYLILRTSWVYAPYGNNFVKTVMRLARQRDRLGIVNDQIGCPTYAPDIADAIIAVARQIAGSGWQSGHGGVTHLAGPDEMSWFEFARRIVLDLATRRDCPARVEAISTKDYPTAAVRPANSRLNCDRLNSVFGLRLPHSSQSLRICLDRLCDPAHANLE